MIDNTKGLSHRHFLINSGAVFSAAVLVACAPAGSAAFLCYSA
jgi:hypothetical protein